MLDDLIAISEEYKEEADRLLKETGLVEYLSEFGQVYFAGAYRYGLMMHGDVDMYVVRDQGYSIEEVFDIFKHLYFQGKFRSYFIGGDWNDPRKGNEFPNGYYVGLKQKVEDERWKFDIWFMTRDEFETLEGKDILKDKVLTNEQRQLILACKKYRNDQKLSVESQTIYDVVMSGQCKSLEDFKNSLNQKGEVA